MKIQNRAMIVLAILAFSFSANVPSCFATQSADDDSAKDTLPEIRAKVQDQAELSIRNDKSSSPTRFLRLQTDEYDNPVALQTATAKYILVDEQGNVVLEVFLEGSIPIADASYFRSFQNRFRRYDKVLYELVIKREKEKPQDAAPPSGFDILQQLSTGTMGLAYQFDEIDYDAKMMIHADLTADQISERLEGRGDDKATLMSDLLTHIIQKLNSRGSTKEGDAGDGSETRDEDDSKVASSADAHKDNNWYGKYKFNVSVFTDPDGIMIIRRMMAMALVDSRILDSSLPPSIHKVLIGDRNDRAMELLFKEAKESNKRIALFFGVGHMADFERQLIDDHGMKLESVNWRNAWDLRDGAIEGAPLEGLIESTFRDSFKNRLREFAKGVTTRKAMQDDHQGTDVETAKKIEAMEQALKMLEEKLLEIEDKSPDDSSEGGESNEPDANENTQGDG